MENIQKKIFCTNYLFIAKYLLIAKLRIIKILGVLASLRIIYCLLLDRLDLTPRAIDIFFTSLPYN